MLADGQRRPDPQARFAPLAKFIERRPRQDHVADDFLRVPEELFAFERKGGFFSYPVEQATAQFAFQSAHRVTDGGLGDKHLLGGGGETARAGQRNKRSQLSAIQQFLHE